MLTLEAISRKIKSAGELRDIVRTMKALSAVNIRHYDRAVASINEYARTVEMGFRVVLAHGPTEALSKPVGEAGVLALVFGTDTGLCGAFNDRVVAHAHDDLVSGERAEGQKTIFCVGARAETLLLERGLSVEEAFGVPDTLSGVAGMVNHVITAIEERLGPKGVLEVMIYSNRVATGSAYRTDSVRMLPLDRSWFEELARMKWPSRVEPDFTMERGELFSALVRQHIFVTLYRAFVESIASENAARLASMQNAERNIEDRLDELNALFRTTRQNSITDELMDIVSGYEALEH